jgi:hypothetical protein
MGRIEKMEDENGLRVMAQCEVWISDCDCIYGPLGQTEVE